MAGKSEKNGGRVERKPLDAPKNLIEAVSTLTEAIMLLRSERTSHFFDLPRAILHAVMDMGKKTVARECGERSDCVQLNAPEIISELHELKRLLTLTMLFSRKKLFRAFLCSRGFDKDYVLLRQATARMLGPAFTVIRDKESKCLIVFIRGTRGLRDMLTNALCAPIPFNHVIYSDGHHGKRNKINVVSGHAHQGMDAAASWVKDLCIPKLLDALQQSPHFKIKIVGHSLGGGTAALLTFKLREIQQFSSTTCVTFGPAACVTLELAEFGKPFIVSVINGYDIVPTLSASSVHDFISEGQTKDTSITNIACSSITSIGSRLPFAKAIAEHAVTRCTEVVKKHRQGTRSLLPWSGSGASRSSQTNCESLLTEEHLMIKSVIDDEEYSSSSEESDNDDTDDDEDELLNQTEKLKLQKQDKIPNIHVKEKEAATTKNMTEEESACHVTTSGRRHLYPPGRIMHIVLAHSSENSNLNHNDHDEKHVYLYETPKQLYGKLRLSKRMIHDHRMKKYLNMLQQLINQQKKNSSNIVGGMNQRNSK